ncbi:MAG: hypothetical protein WCD08_07445 [Steroidobacteraceae bacterium]
MKLQARKTVSISEIKRNQRQTDRDRSPPMRSAFPQVEQLRIELSFNDRTGRAPSPQMHILFPPARAFFRFACPCSECDGEFDLSPVVSALVNDAPSSKRNSNRSVSDNLSCEGVRLRNHVSSRPCPIAVKFRLVASAEKAV